MKKMEEDKSTKELRKPEKKRGELVITPCDITRGLHTP